MTRSTLRIAAAGLALVPATAWAHGDHHGLHGIVHVLTEPAHLGLLLAGALVAAIFGRSLRRLAIRQRAQARVRKD